MNINIDFGSLIICDKCVFNQFFLHNVLFLIYSLICLGTVSITEKYATNYFDHFTNVGICND